MKSFFEFIRFDVVCFRAGWQVKDHFLESNGSSCRSVLKYTVEVWFVILCELKPHTQLTFTCSKSTMERQGQCVISAQKTTEQHPLCFHLWLWTSKFQLGTRLPFQRTMADICEKDLFELKFLEAIVYITSVSKKKPTQEKILTGLILHTYWVR